MQKAIGYRLFTSVAPFCEVSAALKGMRVCMLLRFSHEHMVCVRTGILRSGCFNWNSRNGCLIWMKRKGFYSTWIKNESVKREPLFAFYGFADSISRHNHDSMIEFENKNMKITVAIDITIWSICRSDIWFSTIFKNIVPKTVIEKE